MAAEHRIAVRRSEAEIDLEGSHAHQWQCSPERDGVQAT